MVFKYDFRFWNIILETEVQSLTGIEPTSVRDEVDVINVQLLDGWFLIQIEGSKMRVKHPIE